MGMIADELDRTVTPHVAMTTAKIPLIVSGAGLMSPGGPVFGVTQVDTAMLNQQIDALAKAVTALAKAVRKLEDKK